MSAFDPELTAELWRIAGAIDIHSAQAFTFAKIPRVEQSNDQRSGTPSEPQQESLDWLAQELTTLIYWNCYARPFDLESAHIPSAIDIQHSAEFVAHLSEANCGRSRWDAGWSVYRVAEDGEVQARKGDTHRSPVPGEYASGIGPGVRPSVGDVVSLQVLHESTKLQRGYYFALSETIPDQFDESNSVRFYFNVRASGAALLVQELTSRLNRWQIPFRFKCPVVAAQYERVDTGVLYVPWRFLVPTSRCVVDLLPAIRESLAPNVPLFTKRVADGVGMAEDPGQLRSFGQHRSELLSHGLMDAWLAKGKTSPIDALSNRFAAQGLDPKFPWLNPGSVDHLRLVQPRNTGMTAELPRPESTERTNERFLEIADRIGNRICRDAIWSGDACNWLEWDAEPRLSYGPDPMNDEWVAVHRALGPNAVYRCSGMSLFAGTAGIAVFLLRLYKLTRNSLQLETLIGVKNQLARQLPNVTGTSDTAFYTGWPGAAWVLAEIGFVLGDDDLIDTAVSALESLSQHTPQLPATDIITGSAGLIAPLLGLAARTGRSRLSDVAVWLGEFLVSSAQRSSTGWSWQTLKVATQKHLSGYGHGVAGIISALGELVPITNDASFLEAITEGLRYESSQFSAKEGNWEDHRARADSSNAAFQFGWCHGAPGIGMGRLRLLELQIDAKLNAAGFASTGMPARIRTDFETALDTTISKLTYADDRGQREFCLCHGLAGNSELPLLASEQSGHESLIEHAERVAQLGIDKIENPRMPWPINLSGTGETPVLFNGLTGIGYFYLRMSNPTQVPSILLMRGSTPSD